MKSIQTSNNSVYTYLSDGRTQRYKTATRETFAPQDAIVFVPDYKWVQENCPENERDRFGENETQYTQILLSYMKPGKRTHIINRKGKCLETNVEIQSQEGGVFMTFEDNGKVDFCIPVSKNPRIGFFTYDTRKRQDKDGLMKRQRHLGNKIIGINE